MKSFKLNLSIVMLMACIALTPLYSSCNFRAIIQGTEGAIQRFAALVVACINKQKNGSAVICEGKKLIAEIRTLMMQIPQVSASEICTELRQELYLHLNIICNQIDSVIGVIETKRSNLSTPAFIGALQGPANKLHTDFMQALPIFNKIKATASSEVQNIISSIEQHIAALQTQLSALGKLQSYSIIRYLQS